MSRETKDRLFSTSLDVVRRSRLLEVHKSTRCWGWLFRTYVQWHGVAFLLSELCYRTKGPEIEEAWAAIEEVFEEWGGHVCASKKGMLWKPMRKLMVRARAARKAELERSAMFPTDGSLGPISSYPSEPNHTLNSKSIVSIPGEFDTMDVPALPTFPGIVDDGLADAAPLQPLDISLQGGIGIDNWMLNETYGTSSVQDPLISGTQETMDWAGWDEIVRDFQVDEQGFGGGLNTAVGTMEDWW